MRSPRTIREALSTAVLLALVGLAPPAVAGGESDSRSCPSPRNYCSTSPNSVGTGAVMSWQGTPSLVTDDFYLMATGCPPGQFLVYFYGGARIASPFGNGWRCVGSGGVGIFRFRALQIGNSGTAVMKVDYSRPPAGGGSGLWWPGDIWNCQGWYRDPAGGGAQFNLTDGLAVPVCIDGPYEGMVQVPAGTFNMGRHVGSGNGDQYPIHPVSLDAFYIGVNEVSNQKYADFLNAAYIQSRVTVSAGAVYQVGGAGQVLCDTTASSPWSCITWNGSTFDVIAGEEQHPMALVSWYGACAYANGLSRGHGLAPCYDETTWACAFSADGFRLPTEAEWEYAARGGEHNPYYLYPWGDAIDGSMANFGNSGDPFETGPAPWMTPVGYYDGNQTPAGVDMANGYGLYDMAGNLWEWCGDWYSANYYSSSPSSNPTGPASGTSRVPRGGSWNNGPSALPSAMRAHNSPTTRMTIIGFRVGAARH